MKYWSLILFFLLLIKTLPVKVQPYKINLFEIQCQKEIDSLKQVLIGTPEDTVKVNRLIPLSSIQYNPENTQQEFSLQALSLAEKLNYKKGIVLATNEAGSVYQTNKDYQTAIKYYKKAISLS